MGLTLLGYCCSPLGCIVNQETGVGNCGATCNQISGTCVTSPETEPNCVTYREQCGGYVNFLGQIWNGYTSCCNSYICHQYSIYYFQCITLSDENTLNSL